MCPASARTAASTRTPPPGSCWRRRCRAAATAPSSCSNLLNPIHHADDAGGGGALQGRAVRRLRPTSTARPPHTGRGGWTWYTGSAGWLYRVALEAILGFRLAATRCSFEPCVPPAGRGSRSTYRYRSATYRVRVDNPAGTGRGVRSVTLDGQPVPGGDGPLRDDGRTHDVRVDLG